MKKTFIFMLLMAVSHTTFCQTGAIQLINHNTICSVTVWMYANAISEGDNVCQLYSNPIFLAPAGTPGDHFNAPNCVAFEGLIGWAATPPGGLFTSHPVPGDFFWSDAIFVYSCPCPTINSQYAWGSVGNPLSMCYTTSEWTSWSGYAGTCTIPLSATVTGTGYATYDFH